MDWLDRVLALAESKQAHAFIATLNVRDQASYTDSSSKVKITTTMDATCRRLSQNGRLVVAYTLSRGYALYVAGEHYDPNKPEHQLFGQAFEQGTGLPPVSWRTDAAHTPLSPDVILRTLEAFEHLLYCQIRNGGKRGICLVVENADCLIPSHVLQVADLADRIILEMFLRWGYDLVIREAGNMVLLFAADRGRLPPDILASSSGYQCVTVPLPDESERKRVLEDRTKTLNASVWGPDFSAEEAARSATGLRRADLERLVRAAAADHRKLTYQDVQVEKRRIIEAMAHDLVEVIEPTFGFECARAQPRAREYLERVAKVIRSNPDSPYVPKGLLFVGIPGNGKSHLATAFAKEAQMNMLRLKNIRSMWVGESERNLETLFDLLPQLAPVVVFIDEIDQAVVARSMGGTTTHSSDVESRILARMLAFMGDNRYRGKILWIGATNRPDLLDVAMIRRFDRVLPFMNPSGEDVKGLVEDLVARLGIETSDTDWNLERVAQLVEGNTCDGIEKIIRRATELAYLYGQKALRTGDVELAAQDFKPNYDPRSYDYIMLLTIRAVSYLSDLPWFGKPLPANLPSCLDGVLTVNENNVVDGVDVSRLEERIREFSF